jgi:hypothetical protein
MEKIMLFNQIRTASQLAGFVSNSTSDSFYFSKDTLRFFGDSMSNYGIKHHKLGARHIVELRRKRAVKHGMTASAYFELEQGQNDKAKKISSNDAEEAINNAK